MNDGQVMGYPLLGWIITMAWILAAWLAAVTVWMIRSNLRWNRHHQDLGTLGDLFAEAIRGLSARITTQSGEENVNGQSSHFKPGRGKEGLTAKFSSKESTVRVRVEESASTGNSKTRENCDT